MILNKSTPSGIYQPNQNLNSVGQGSISNLSTIYQNQAHATLFSQGGTNDVCSSGFQLLNPSHNNTFENEGSSFNNTRANNTKRSNKNSIEVMSQVSKSGIQMFSKAL
jgi:hypothetical protein